MALSKEVKAKLSKAPLLTVGWYWRHPYFAKFRLANAVKLKLWWLSVEWRAPWLEESARALHPELFRSSATQVAEAA